MSIKRRAANLMSLGAIDFGLIVDRLGSVAGLRADGISHWHRRGGAASTGNRRHRRTHHVYIADIVCTACALRLV